MPRILAFAGSARKGSFNKLLVAAAAAGARNAGAEVTLVDLADYPLPVFDQDFEAESGLPENARKLKEIFAAHNGLLISTPEYNGSIPPLLKNVIDWVSRKADPDEPMKGSYLGKTAVVMSASPGGLGGLRALRHVREILDGISVLVLPEQRAVGQAHEVFDEQGAVRDGKLRTQIEALGAALAERIRKLES